MDIREAELIFDAGREAVVKTLLHRRREQQHLFPISSYITFIDIYQLHNICMAIYKQNSLAHHNHKYHKNICSFATVSMALFSAATGSMKR